MNISFTDGYAGVKVMLKYIHNEKVPFAFEANPLGIGVADNIGAGLEDRVTKLLKQCKQGPAV